MSDVITDDQQGNVPPVLTAQLLAQVHALNLDYLELLAGDCGADGDVGQAVMLPEPQRFQLGKLPSLAHRQLAQLPFALYSLQFEDEAFWETVLGSGLDNTAGLVARERYACTAGHAGQVFCELALLQAWHVAASNRLGARIVHVMPDAIAVSFARLPLWRVKRIAAEHPDLLKPRWATHPCFWADLLHFVRSGDPAGLAAAKLRGNQLVAAFFEPSCVGRQGLAAQRCARGVLRRPVMNGSCRDASSTRERPQRAVRRRSSAGAIRQGTSAADFNNAGDVTCPE